MERDDPWHELRQMVEEAALGDHPYRFPIIGYQSDVESLGLDALRAHYRRFYSPSNAVLVVAGDINLKEARKRVGELFGGIPAGQAASAASEAPRGSGLQRIEARPQGRTDRFSLAFPAPSMSDHDSYAFTLLDSILVEGRLSRLHSRLVEITPVAAFVSGDFGDTAEPYLYFLRLELLPGSRFELGEQILFEELDKLRSEGVTELELERAKNQNLFGTVASFETSFDLAAQIGLVEIQDRPGYWQSYLDCIESVTVRDVQDAAARYLDPERGVIGVSPRAL
jgi:zinc protease